MRPARSRGSRGFRGKRGILFLGRLEAYASAGLPIADAFVGSGFDSFGREVENGKPLSSCLAAAGMPPSLVGVLRCGERSGSLPESLKACRIVLERRAEAVRRAAVALTYPSIIGIAAIALSAGIMEGVIPQIEPMLSGMHADLPVITRAAIWASRSLGAWWLHASIASILIVSGSGALYICSSRTKQMAHRVVAAVPFVGSMAVRYSLSSFFRSVGYMMEAGAQTTEACRDALGSVALIPTREGLAHKIEGLERGKPFSSVVGPGIAPYVAALLDTGEASGRLGSSCLTVADMLERDLATTLERAGSLLEPVMTVGVGGMVGATALSIMMPIYELSKSLQPR